MNSLVKRAALAVLWRKNPLAGMTAVRNHWNKDFAPGPYPTTLEARMAAAKKYNVPLEEYKPYEGDDDGLGDYPKLPAISAESRDPFYPWDNPELKRNFEETLHDDFDYMRGDRYDVSKKLRFSLTYQWIQTISVLSVLAVIYWFSLQVKMFHAVIPPQLPREGKTHYTFEKC